MLSDLSTIIWALTILHIMRILEATMPTYPIMRAGVTATTCKIVIGMSDYVVRTTTDGHMTVRECHRNNWKLLGNGNLRSGLPRSVSCMATAVLMGRGSSHGDWSMVLYRIRPTGRVSRETRSRRVITILRPLSRKNTHKQSVFIVASAPNVRMAR